MIFALTKILQAKLLFWTRTEQSFRLSSLVKKISFPEEFILEPGNQAKFTNVHPIFLLFLAEQPGFLSGLTPLFTRSVLQNIQGRNPSLFCAMAVLKT